MGIVYIVCTVLLIYLLITITYNPRKILYNKPPPSPITEYNIVRIYQVKLQPYHFKIGYLKIFDAKKQSIMLRAKDKRFQPLLDHKFYEEKSNQQIAIELLIPNKPIKRITLSSQGVNNNNTYIDVITFAGKKSYCLGNYREVDGLISISF